MKKEISHIFLRKVFNWTTVVIFALFLASLGWLYVSFGDLLSGQVRLETAPSLLTPLQSATFDLITKRLQKRETLPYPPENLRNPFNLAPASPPVPQPLPPPPVIPPR